MRRGARAFLIQSLPVLTLLAIATGAAGTGADHGNEERPARRSWISLPSVSRIGVLEVIGPIYDSRYWIGEINRLKRNPLVKAMVVRIDTPGGEVGAVQEITKALERYRDTGRPVVASFGGVAASGGYYLACAADRIVSNPGTLTGSIGVAMEFPDAEGLLKKLGVKFVVVKSGRFKDTGNFSRSLNEAELKLLQDMVQDVYEQFLEAVWEARQDRLREALARIRGVPAEKLKPGDAKRFLRSRADGRVMSGRQALKAGLVDELGGLQFALREAAILAGLSGRPGVVSHKRRRTASWRDLIGIMLGIRERSGFSSSGESARLEYRYRPSL